MSVAYSCFCVVFINSASLQPVSVAALSMNNINYKGLPHCCN